MKLFLSLLITSLLAAGQAEKSEWHLRPVVVEGHSHHLRRLQDTGFFYIVGDVEGRDCIAPGGTQNGDKLFLRGDCSSTDQAWRRDDDDRFHTALDDNVCMQAGHGQGIEDGNKLRMYRCDDGEVLQQFDWVGSIKPRTDPTLCVVQQGATRELNDEIILKTCSAVGGNRLGWSYEDFDY